MDILVKKKRAKPPKSVKNTNKCTDKERLWTELYYFGGPETKGNAAESYRVAYPDTSEKTIQAHAAKMVDRAGVKFAYDLLYEEHKKTFTQTLAECKEFPAEPELLNLLGLFILNKEDLNGNTFCTRKLQFIAIKTGLELYGAFDKKISNPDDVAEIEINISTNEQNKEPLRKLYQDVLETQFNE